MTKVNNLIEDILDKNGFPNHKIPMDLNLQFFQAWDMLRIDCHSFKEPNKLLKILKDNIEEIKEVYEKNQEEIEVHYKNYSKDEAKKDAVEIWSRVLKYAQQFNPIPKYQPSMLIHEVKPMPITKVKELVLSDNQHLRNLKFACSYCEQVKFPHDTTKDTICKSKCIGVKYGVFCSDKNANAYLCTQRKSLYMKLGSFKNKIEYVETVQTLLNNMKGVLSNGKSNDRTKQGE